MRRQLSSLTLANAVITATSVAMTVALARTLGPVEFGQVVFAQTAAALLFAVLDPRLEDALVRYVPILESGSDPGAATALFGRLLAIDAILGLGFAAMVVAVVSTLAFPLGHTADGTLLALAIVQMGVRASQGTSSAAYAVTSGLVRLGAAQVVAAMVLTTVGLCGLLAGGAVGYLASTAAASVLVSFAMCWSAGRRMRRRYGSPSRRGPVPAGMVRFTWRSSLASSLATGTEQLPLTILGAVAGPETLGVFRVALSPARLVAALFSPIASILFPTLSTAAAAGAHHEVSVLARSWTHRLAPVALVAAAGMVAALPLLVPLMFGEAFEDAVPAAVLLCLAALLRGAVVWSKVMPLAIGRPDVRIVVLAAEGALLAVSTWILAGDGASAVATAHLAVAAGSTLTWMWVLRRIERLAAPDDGDRQNASRTDIEHDRAGG